MLNSTGAFVCHLASYHQVPMYSGTLPNAGNGSATGLDCRDKPGGKQRFLRRSEVPPR
jgi:hypothetical protein